MKKFMAITGVEGKDMVFCFTDSQVVDESMLEDINSILNSGEIPNIFLQEELDKICSDMIPVCDALGVASCRDNCIATFVQRVWDKLHIVLCMSPVGDALRIRCRQFPSLLNCATVDYYLTWPESALHAVASHFLSSVHLGSGNEALETAHHGALVELCVKVHTSIERTADDFYTKLRRRTYTTPKSYLDLINMYSAKLGELQAGVDAKIDQMTIGTQKLAETNAIVGGLREELKELAPILVEKKLAAEEMLKQVAIDQAEAEMQKQQVSVEEAELNKKSKKLQPLPPKLKPILM
uniref:Dynein heavy chain AAA module D4 domain-containing protein n=1 Tax=Aureoumbra lagunensis TaxID=44058 RepID=A0A7S3NNG4_9STRA